MKILIATLILLLFSNFSSANSEPSVESQQFCMDMGHYAEEIAVARDTTGIQHEEYLLLVLNAFNTGAITEQFASTLIFLAEEVYVERPEVSAEKMYDSILSECIEYHIEHGL